MGYLAALIYLLVPVFEAILTGIWRARLRLMPRFACGKPSLNPEIKLNAKNC